MLNQFVLVGKLIEQQTQEQQTNLKVSIPRVKANMSDDLTIILNGQIANATKYLHINDLVGIKGTIQNNNGKMQLVADKITFLSSKQEN